MKLSEINEGLIKNNYIPTKQITYAVSGAINQQFPVLIEGDPGVGKTSLAKAVAKMLDLPLYRVQFYEGLSADKILYDYDYQQNATFPAEVTATKFIGDGSQLTGIAAGTKATIYKYVE